MRGCPAAKQLSMPRWAGAAGLPRTAVPLAQAAALLADWRALMWRHAGLRAGAWRDVRALLGAARVPPVLAARFVAERARALGAEGALTLREQFNLLQVWFVFLQF